MNKVTMLLAVLLVVVFFIFYYFKLFNWIEVFELKTLDFRYRVRGVHKIDPHVVIVGIDEESIANMWGYFQDEWPWQRYHYAKIIKKLFEKGAKVVVFDISFTTQDEVNRKNDIYLASILRKYRNVVLGSYLINSKETFEKYPESAQGYFLKNKFYLRYSFKLKNPEYLEVFYPIRIYKIIPPLPDFSAQVPSSTYEIGSLDIDGTVRNMELVFYEQWSVENNLSNGYIPHMDLIAYSMYKNNYPTNILLDPKEYKIIVGNEEIPIDSGGYYQIYFYGKGEDIFQTISFYDFLYGNLDVDLKDKIVIIGYTATAKGLYDLRVTPFSNDEPGVYVHANLIENLIRGDSLRRLNPIFRLAFLIAAIILTLLILKTKNKYFKFLSFSIPLFLPVVSYYLFVFNHIWLDTFYPVFATIIISSYDTVVSFIQEFREKRKIREFLFRYVPDTVAERLLEQGKVELGGEKKEVIILFSDIKGFTEKSEKLTPEQVVQFLNYYLSKMAEIIRTKYYGMIDKFIGDAIMAVFGAPIPADDDLERALKCSLDMVEEMKNVSKDIRAMGFNFDVSSGIGMHIGEVVVGNIGASFRMDYTCIGDVVNTASRIEHLTRDVGKDILVSEEIYERAKDKFIFEFVGEYKVKGKAKPLKIYALIGEKKGEETLERENIVTES